MWAASARSRPRPPSCCGRARAHIVIQRSARSLANPLIQESTDVVVIGLGRFGSAVSLSLTRLGHQVLAIEEDAAKVQFYSDRLSHVVQADATDAVALRRLGVGSFN